MAISLDQQPFSLPKKSIWKRIASKREPAPTPQAVSALPPTTTNTPPQKLRRRTTKVYRDAPPSISQISRKATIHLPLTPNKETIQTDPTKRETKPKESIKIMNVQRIKMPSVKEKPRVISLTRVTSSDMRTNPFPASPHVRTVAWNVSLTPENTYNLVMGFSPVGIDDKWFIYSQGPDHSGKLKVHFHRSWTGMKIAELFIIVDLEGEGAGSIVGVKWNGTDQTNGMDEDEAKYMLSTACSWVLDVDLERGALPAMKC